MSRCKQFSKPARIFAKWPLALGFLRTESRARIFKQESQRLGESRILPFATPSSSMVRSVESSCSRLKINHQISSLYQEFSAEKLKTTSTSKYRCTLDLENHYVFTNKRNMTRVFMPFIWDLANEFYFLHDIFLIGQICAYNFLNSDCVFDWQRKFD